METVEAMLAQLLREFRAFSERVERTQTLPMVLTKERAAQALDVSVSTLKGMIRRAEIRTAWIAKRQLIPRSEVLRIAMPGGPTPPPPGRKNTRRAAKEARSEAEKIRALARRRD